MDSDGDNSSDVESEISQEVSNTVGDVVQAKDMMLLDSSSSEDEKRVVRSHHDKYFDELRTLCTSGQDLAAVGQWVDVKSVFESINKLLAGKMKSIVASSGIPNAYIVLLVSLEDSIELAGGAKLNKANRNAFVRMKNMLKKHNRDFSRSIEECRAHPENFQNDLVIEDESSNDDIDDFFEESEDDYDQFEESEAEFDDDSSSDSELELDIDEGGITRDFWVKKSIVSEGMDKVAELEKLERQKERRLLREKEKAEREEKWSRVERDGAVNKFDGVTFTLRFVREALETILQNRMKKNSDRVSMIADLKILSENAMTPAIRLKLDLTRLGILLNLTLNKAGYLTLEYFKIAIEILTSSLKLLRNESNVLLVEGEVIDEFVFPEEDAKDGTMAMSHEELSNQKFFVSGCMFSFVTRLHQHFIDALVSIEPQSDDYLVYLSGEVSILKVASETQRYYESLGLNAFVCNSALLRAEILYSKYIPRFDTFVSGVLTFEPLETEGSEFSSICSLLLARSDDSWTKSRCMLFLVYNAAMHNQFERARDLFLIAESRGNFTDADVSTQILYNRVIAQLSICAFRCGNYKEALQLVSDLYSTGKIKEILAQGITNRYNTETRMVLLEKKHRLPFHLHISLDLLDAVHVLSAMLLEIPEMALNSDHVRSKNFRKLWLQYTRDPFNAPPDTSRDWAMQAAKALSLGQWEKSLSMISNMKMWALVHHKDVVLLTLREALKVNCLYNFVYF